MDEHQNYLEHREERIARSKAWIDANRERHNENARQYYHRHREERLHYYHAHKEERTAYSRAYQKLHDKHPSHNVIKHNGQVIVSNVHKPPKPFLCILCSRRSHLIYHHWEDDKPDIGLWICNRCHAAIHRMIRIGLLEASIRSQDIITKRKIAAPFFQGSG